jgi:hypothetical protein
MESIEFPPAVSFNYCSQKDIRDHNPLNSFNPGFRLFGPRRILHAIPYLLRAAQTEQLGTKFQLSGMAFAVEFEYFRQTSWSIVESTLARRASSVERPRATDTLKLSPTL